MAPQYKLTYFNARGVGETIRFILSYGGAEFEDVRVSHEDWEKLKPNFPFRQLPVLEVNGKQINQSSAICRYLAKQFGLTGSNDWEALEVDAIVDTFNDVRNLFMAIRAITDEAEREKKKQAILKEALPHSLSKFDEMVKKNGGYLVGGKLTWADLYFVAGLESWSRASQQNIVEIYPNIKVLNDKVLAIPSIKAWVAKRPKTEM